MKAAFSTLGCRVNQYETEAMIEKFKKDGYEIVEFTDKADVYVINTCTVTNNGDKKSRQMISRAKRENPDAIIAVVGCYSQISPKDVSCIEGVDVVLGTKNKGNILYYVEKAMSCGKQFIDVHEVLKENKFEDLNIEDYENKTRAFLKIQDGCNRFCSYCIIPYARGAVCSKEPQKIFEEINKLQSHGFTEITLSGINIGSYGVDLNGDWNLIKVLQEVDKMTSISRIRIGSIDPDFFTDENIEKIAKLKNLCPHFHISLQSGCDETLKRMNRRYTTKKYKEVVLKLKDAIPSLSITTDIIVGFPGETEIEFNETYEFLKNISLTRMHVFKYSPREGTKAASMENVVDGNIKEYRSSKLIKLSEDCERKFMEKFLNKKLPVLYEDKKTENKFEGYTENYLKVLTESQNCIEGKIIETKLIGIKGDYLIGEILLE